MMLAMIVVVKNLVMEGMGTTTRLVTSLQFYNPEMSCSSTVVVVAAMMATTKVCSQQLSKIG